MFWYVPGVGRRLHAAFLFLSLMLQRLPTLLLRRWDCLVGSWGYPDAVAVAAIARLSGTPMIAKVHGSDVNVFTREPSRRAQICWALNRSRHVVAVSRALAERLAEIGVDPGKATVLYNGVDPVRFHPVPRDEARRALGFDEADRVLLFIGNIQASKGCMELLDAFGRLRERMPDLSLVFIGAGPQARALSERAAALGASERVRFAGRLAHEQIVQWFGAADVFCLPSHAEGVPNVVLEAMACGTPVVATRVGGIPEVLPAYAGLMVPPQDAAALRGGFVHSFAHRVGPRTHHCACPCLRLGYKRDPAARADRRRGPTREPAPHTMIAVEIAFWLAALAIVYTYFLYPVLLLALSALKQLAADLRYVAKGGTRRPVTGQPGRVPTVAVLVAAYNEERHIAERIRNLLACDYPPELLRVYIGSDGSSDATNRLVEEARHERLVFRPFEQRRGKPSVINDLAALAHEEILVFTDANTSFEPDAMRRLVRHFTDPGIGCVCGELRLVAGAKNENPDNVYWRYERVLKFFESRLGALLGANGGVYALRREHYRAIPPDTIVDDFSISVDLIERGLRCVYDPRRGPRKRSRRASATSSVAACASASATTRLCGATWVCCTRGTVTRR